MNHTQAQAGASSPQDRFHPDATDRAVKTEHAASSPRLPASPYSTASFRPFPAAALAAAEPAESGATTPRVTSGHPAKKRGTASTLKRGPKKFKAGRVRKNRKTPKTGSAGPGADEAPLGDEGSDNGPYCVCRGPDDHRWMICCERCEDWFHGECINMNKEIGEHLIEKFICPNCATDERTTIYKKTCALGACCRPARLAESEPSVFCSSEHAEAWWERMVSRLPKTRGGNGLDHQLAQDEFMALLNSHLGAADGNGMWKVARTPFSDTHLNGVGENQDGTTLYRILSDEENELLDQATRMRSQLEEETVLCHKMFTLIELAQERRRAAIHAGRFGEDICGYDSRLDVVSARDVFAAFVESPEGEDVFQQSRLGDPMGEDDLVRGMCERKRCKAHSGWQKVLALGIKQHIREMAEEVAEMEDEEKVVRAAAGERWKRRQAESNWVEVVDG